MGFVKRLLYSLILLSSGVTLWGAGPFTPPAKGSGSGIQATNTMVESLPNGEFRLGLVRFSKQPPALFIPATLNMTNGVLEYILVHAEGKTHESLLKTDAHALHIHLAALLVGLSTTNTVPGVQPIPLRVSAQWIDASGKTNEAPHDLWIAHRPSSRVLSPGLWHYTGSRVVEGSFMAQRDGSILSLITDPDALIGNPRPDRDVDDAWQVDKSNVPPLETRVILRLEPWKP